MVVRPTSRSAPDGVLVLPLAAASARGDRSPRLVWLDANKPSVMAASTHGTRKRALRTPPEPLRFPRALARDPATGHLLVGEWLGRIWAVPPDAKSQKLLRDDASTAAAAVVRATVDDEERIRGRLQPALVTLLKV